MKLSLSPSQASINQTQIQRCGWPLPTAHPHTPNPPLSGFLLTERNISPTCLSFRCKQIPSNNMVARIKRKRTWWAQARNTTRPFGPHSSVVPSYFLCTFDHHVSTSDICLLILTVQLSCPRHTTQSFHGCMFMMHVCMFVMTIY